MRIFPSLFLGLTASFCVLAASGCGSLAGGGSSAVSDLAVLNQFEAEAVQRFCARISACCNELSYPFDEAGCEQLNGNSIVQFFNTESFQGAHYDPAAGKRCLDSIETPELGCSANGDYQSADCKQVFVGSVPLGGKCSRSEGCAAADGAATLCDFPPNPDFQDPGLTGVCVLDPTSYTGPHGNPGDACSTTCTGSGLCDTLCGAGQTCPTGLPTCYTADGLFCSEANTCVPLGVVGDPCRGSPECGVGTYCDIGLGQQAGRVGLCQSLRQAGDTCQNGPQCETEYCSRALTASAGTCMSRPVADPDFCLGHIPPPPH